MEDNKVLLARDGRKGTMVQENAGFYLSIAKDLDGAGKQAAQLTQDSYERWLQRGWAGVTAAYKSRYFSIAVGGGNTVKAQYRALLRGHATSIDWVKHVRFFFLEESSGEKHWQSSRDALIEDFLIPLAHALSGRKLQKKLLAALNLDRDASPDMVTARMVETMTVPIDMKPVSTALKKQGAEQGLAAAAEEAARYRGELEHYLGKDMAFHLIITGIGKDGGIGAFSAYSPGLKRKKPAVIALPQQNGAVRVALNRGILVNADRVSLIISGNHKLKALGRFEMEDSANFEQTVQETPLRIFREKRDIARKVCIFADAEALHFEEGQIRFRHNKRSVTVRTEVRDGLEKRGIHIQLLHGFMGLYSYVNLIIRLPNAWKVSALHRGKLAKNMPEEEIFPHYALCLRKAVLQNWKRGYATPICGHSMGGVICDHLLLSTLKNIGDPLPEFDELGKENQALIRALRTSGIVHLAAWTPADVIHLLENIDNLSAHLRRGAALDYGGPELLYITDSDNRLRFNPRYEQAMYERPKLYDLMIKFPGTRHAVHLLNRAVRYVLGKQELQKMMSSREVPYGLRVIGERMLKKISFYGLLKEVSAAMHAPYDYIDRHFRALDIIIKYDIPFLSMIHADDFIVSANRHQQEYQHLLARRLKKEGVDSADALRTPVRFVLLQREQKNLPVDPLNPHLMLMSTYLEGDRIAREITSEMTRFVNENIARAAEAGEFRMPPSVRRWQRRQAKQG